MKKPSVRTLVIAAALLTLSGGLGATFLPALLTHSPLGLLAMSPLYRHMVLVATRVDFLPYMLVGIPARLLGSLLGYVVGVSYGERSIVWMEQRWPRMARFIRLLERGFERAGPLLLFAWPGPLFCSLAGATGMRTWLFLVLATLGQALQLAVAYHLGAVLAPWLDPIVAFFRDYTSSATLVFVLLALLYYRWRKPRWDSELRGLQGGTGER